MGALVAACAAVQDQAWEDYKLEYNKHYTAEEELTRYTNWKKSVEEVTLHNAAYGHEFTTGINDMSDLTEEEIVDCSGRYGNYGCQGGWYQSSWRYLRDAGGDDPESDYPYTARQGHRN